MATYIRAKRYDPARPPAVSMEPDAGVDWVIVEDYYSLLALARRLREQLTEYFIHSSDVLFFDTSDLLNDSARLED